MTFYHRVWPMIFYQGPTPGWAVPKDGNGRMAQY